MPRTVENTLPRPPTEQERRTYRWQALEFVRQRTQRGGGLTCMMPAPTASVVRVGVDSSGRPHVMGVRRCASSTACPICTPTIRHSRAAEVDLGIANHLDNGGGGVFATFTQPHGPNDDLARLIKSNQAAWTHTITGAAWSRMKKSLGICGQIKVVEATWGVVNGWHPHLHVAILTNAPITEAQRAALWRWLLDRWSMGLALAGRGTKSGRPSEAMEWYGVDVRMIDREGLGKYALKVKEGWGIGQELARGDLKRGTNGRWSPYELLASAVEDGDARHARLWDEYDQGTTNVAAITWSPRLKARLGVVDLSDDDLAAVDLDEVRACVDIPAADWKWYLRTRRCGDLLNEIAAALLPWARYSLCPTPGRARSSPEPVPLAA